ncbi:unnamed protein product [Orchesella dallaii]|uniref:peptidylprolyl isomerase n=1 Tax=Orchesella dallaii TaxID=48710 RepID=A0ABP1Q0Y1_9HEXA
MEGTTMVTDEVPVEQDLLAPLINDRCVDISKEGDTGKLYIEFLGENDPTAERPGDGCEVFVHYIGTLPDGTEFDRSDKKAKPFNFMLGEGSVIKGWDLGIAKLSKGQRAKLYIHPDYGYGVKGSGKIPANSPLIFEVTLVDFKPEDLTSSKSGALLRSRIQLGKSKFLNPNEGSSLTVSLIGEYQGSKFDERTVSFVLGEGGEHNIPYGVEKALFKFSEGEISRLTLGPKYAFGSKGSAEFNIPPDSTVQYIVELKTFERTREAWQMDPPEKLEMAVKAKAKGTVFFTNEKFNLATRQYKNIVNFLKTEASLEGDEEELRKSLLLAAYLNQALCHLKLNEPVVAKRNADEAIELSPNNPKAFYRRGLANLGIKEAYDAKDDFQKVLQIEPDNKAAKQQLAVCDKLIKQHKEREKQVYSKMFEKFAKLDTAKEQAELRKQPNGLDNLDEWSKGSGEKMEVDENSAPAPVKTDD